MLNVLARADAQGVVQPRWVNGRRYAIADAAGKVYPQGVLTSAKPPLTDSQFAEMLKRYANGGAK